MAFINSTVILIPLSTCATSTFPKGNLLLWGVVRKSYKQHNIYIYSKHECQEMSVLICIAAFCLKAVMYESNFYLEKIYKASNT